MSSLTPKVSYVLTSYNFADTIRESLDCIFNDAADYCELIYRDDCSSDGTYESAVSYLNEKKKSRFLNVSHYRNSENEGASANISKAISEAQGEYVRIIAGDDFISPGSTGKLMEFSKRENKKACIGHARFIKEGQTGISKPMEFLRPNRIFRTIFPNMSVDDFFFRTLFFWDLRGSVLLIENSFLRHLGGISSSEALEDWDLLIRVSFEQQLGYYPGAVATVTTRSREVELAKSLDRIEWTFETLDRHRDKIKKRFGLSFWILYSKFHCYKYLLYIYRFFGRVHK